MAHAEPAFAGQTINSYRIVRKLGAGGMGQVFRAVDTKLNRNVALKFLPDELQADEQAWAQLLREAQAASALDHPNVGTIYGIEQTPAGRMFIVMAFYDGQTLAQKIASAKSLPVGEVVHISNQIASGLAEAHSHRIVHRDIKPSNIILTAQSGAKILDFGLARVISSASVTQSLGLAGTVSYMSPQQALGRAIDQRTDLWSLGVTMYEMLAGRLPFEAGNSASMLMAIVHSAPRNLDAAVPLALQRIIYKLLVKDAEQRYQEIADVQADLRGMSENKQATPLLTPHSELNRLRALAATPITLSARAMSRPERWAVALAGFAVLAVLVSLYPSLQHRFWAGANVPTQQHIAVLPLQTRSQNASDAELSEGLRESITDRLSNLQAANRSLWVVPASEVSARKIGAPGEASRAFGANLVVQGRLEREGQLVRLTLELVDAAQLRQLGAAEAESADGNLSEVEDTALRQLESKLDLPPGDAGTERPGTERAGASVAPTAYENYLKALPLIDRWDKPNNLETARALLGSAIRSDPDFPLAYVSLANADLKEFQTSKDRAWLDRAASNCNRAQHLNSQLAAVHVTMGRVQDASGRRDFASNEFELALRLEPHSAEATLGKALVFDHQGRLEMAEVAFKQAAALRPDYWDSYNQLGLFYYRHQRYGEAIQAFRSASKLVPDSIAPYLNLGAALMDSGRPGEAIEPLEKASAIAPNYGASANLAQIFYKRKRFADAERVTLEALKMYEGDWAVWTNLAAIRRWRHEEKEALGAERRAVPLMEAAIQVNPQDAELQVDLGVVYADLGKKDDAESKMETALTLAPSDGGIAVAAAEVCEKLGEHQRAIALFKKALGEGVALNAFSMDPDLQPLLADHVLRESAKQFRSK